MSNYIPKAIGGYFELELQVQKEPMYADALHFQSARAAFYALLMEGKPDRVWMPKYICDSMLAPLKTAVTEIIFYDLDLDLGVSDEVQIKDSDWLLYVNYFGVCSLQEDLLLKRFNPMQLVFDHSQAFFSPPRECLATIYSPRKFFGIPDGGLLFTSQPVTEPKEIDDGSMARCSHLLKRLHERPEVGYQDFKNAEETLYDIKPRKMSLLTDRLLTAIDYDACKNKRNTNFLFLHNKLKQLNDLNLVVSHIDGPMCYPMLVDDDTIRDRLLAKSIFVPTYWPEAFGRVELGSFDRRLLEKCLALPCDQRYDQEDMVRIIESLQDI